MAANRRRCCCHGERPALKALDEALGLPFSQHARRQGVTGGRGGRARHSRRAKLLEKKKQKQNKWNSEQRKKPGRELFPSSWRGTCCSGSNSELRLERRLPSAGWEIRRSAGDLGLRDKNNSRNSGADSASVFKQPEKSRQQQRAAAGRNIWQRVTGFKSLWKI